MTNDDRGEIILVDGRAIPLERRSRQRDGTSYRRPVVALDPMPPRDRRQRQRLRDAVVRGRLIDISG